ncbi:hypothetical protein PR048_028470 [Dryococelus australis]|uniref:Secreted protein n=1 Tax=Dryococelus australis TaxID=614101 RepID=A0ABQ9GAM9_9NEOP|nr:hypothetical protein PR048_028470 [Dryococelus australis]
MARLLMLLFRCGNIIMRCSQNAGLDVNHPKYKIHLSGHLEALTFSTCDNLLWCFIKNIVPKQRCDMDDGFTEALRQVFRWVTPAML